MEFYWKGREENREGLRILLDERGYALSDNERGEDIIHVFTEETQEERLCVSYTEGGLQIRYCRKAHFFRGFMKFLRDWESGGVTYGYGFEEKVWFDHNGAMLDCSRNGVLTVEKVKEFIRRMASLGMNRLMLYTEDTYALKKYPYFGAFRGRYTAQELRECDSYAAIFGVEMVPCIQTLAHLHTALRWSAHDKLRDTEDILLTDSDEVYELIREMVRTMASCFRNKEIHLGMDEAHDLGLGRYLAEHGFHGQFEIMTRHLQRVCQICREEGLRPMIWSDMYFRVKSPLGEYYDLPADTDLSGFPKPPEDLCMVYWDYYHEKKEHYDNYFRLHGQLSSRVTFAGGAWIWNGLAPNYSKMHATTRSALASCRENGIRDVMCAFWQDNGAETPMAAGVPALAYYAENGFMPAGDEFSGNDRVFEDRLRKEIGRWLAFLWGGSRRAWELLDRFDRTEYALEDNMGEDNPSKFLLYQDVLAGLFDAQIKGLELAEHYAVLAAELVGCLEECESGAPLFAYYKTLAELLSRKANLGIRIYDAYHGNDREALREILEATLPFCAQKTRELLEQRRKLWFAECGPFGFEVLDIRLAGLEGRLRSAGMRLGAYLDGSVTSLPELEEPRLIYRTDPENPGRRLCSCNLWENIVSAGNIVGV